MIGNQQNMLMQYLMQMQNRGLLGGQSGGGLLGGGQQQNNTQNMMQRYLQQLSQRRYNPPAIPQQPGMVSSQMGPGGMQYQAPQMQRPAAPVQPQQQMNSPQMQNWWQQNVGQYMPDGGSQQGFNQWGGGA